MVVLLLSQSCFEMNLPAIYYLLQPEKSWNSRPLHTRPPRQIYKRGDTLGQTVCHSRAGPRCPGSFRVCTVSTLGTEGHNEWHKSTQSSAYQQTVLRSHSAVVHCQVPRSPAQHPILSCPWIWSTSGVVHVDCWPHFPRARQRYTKHLNGSVQRCKLIFHLNDDDGQEKKYTPTLFQSLLLCFTLGRLVVSGKCTLCTTLLAW